MNGHNSCFLDHSFWFRCFLVGAIVAFVHWKTETLLVNSNLRSGSFMVRRIVSKAYTAHIQRYQTPNTKYWAHIKHKTNCKSPSFKLDKLKWLNYCMLAAQNERHLLCHKQKLRLIIINNCIRWSRAKMFFARLVNNAMEWNGQRWARLS